MKPDRPLIYLVLLAVLAGFLAYPAAAQEDEDEGEEQDLRPARERFALDTEFAVGRWMLAFDNDTPDSVVVEKEDGTKEVIWYMTFTVSNHTDREVPLRLSFDLTTDVEVGPRGERKTLVYHDTVNPAAEAKVEARLGPLENSLTEMRGLRRHDVEKGEGEDLKPITSLSYIGPGELRKGIVIFGAVTPHADMMQIDVHGLVDPVRHTSKEVQQEIKVWRIIYERPGDPYERQRDALEQTSSEWVVLSRKTIRERQR